MNEETRIPAKERDSSLDTLKCILIFFVVFGHVLEEVSVTGFLGTVRAMIYCFHMPVFVFLSGYFSKSAKHMATGVIKGCLIPFFLYNTVFCLLVGKYDFLTPQYLYWYLLSLCFWRISAVAFSRIKYILPLSIVIALYAGTINDADRFLGIQRTLSFFPFFWAGVMVRPDILGRLRKIKTIYALIVVLLVELTVVIMSITGFMATKMYEMIEPYNRTVPGNQWEGVLHRAIVITIGFICIYAVLSLCRRSHYYLSEYGKRTASILVYSGFVVKIISNVVYRVIPNVGTLPEWMVLLASMALAVVIVIICGSHRVYGIYELLNQKIYTFICAPQDREI